MNNKVAIEIRDLFYSYDKSIPLLAGVNLQILEGSILTILGKNGTGKTTLLNCIMGYIEKYDGDIFIYGKNQTDYTRRKLASFIGFVPQLSQLSFDYTVEEFVLMGCNSSLGYFSVPNKEMQKRVDKALGELGIEWLKKRYINSLSGGERQMVYIARALVQQSKVIVLDEPTSALDFGNTLKIIDLLCMLRELGYAIVLTCHNPDFPLSFKDYTAAIMPNHQVIYGESEKILTDDVLTKIYNVPIKRVNLGDNYVCVKA